MNLQPDSGSFRDPLSRVFVEDDWAWRGLAEVRLADYRALAASAFFAAALERGDIVGTELVTPDRAAIPGQWAGVLRHERLDVITYPYEWAFEMLRDAARLQLDLTRAGARRGLITKDASAYNVQFRGTRPVFIDVGSFERLPARAVAGLPTVLRAVPEPVAGAGRRRRAASGRCCAAACTGSPPTTAAAMLGGRGRLTKGVFTHVKLHARAEGRYADADQERDVKDELRRAGFGPAIIDAQLKNLLKAVDGADAGTSSDRPGRTTPTDPTTPTGTWRPRTTSSVAPSPRRSERRRGPRPRRQRRPLLPVGACCGGRPRSSPSTATTSSSTGCTAPCVPRARRASCRS